MSGVILHSLDLHYNSHNAQCCWLTHLALVNTPCSEMVRAGWALDWEWGWSCPRQGRRRKTVHFSPAPTQAAKFSLGPFRWQACLTPLAQDGDVECTEQAVREVGTAHQIEKVSGMVLLRKVHLLQAQELDGCKLHSGRGPRKYK